MDYSTKMGVLWKKNGAKGEYMTGYFEVNGERHNVVVFTNNKRPGKQDPDYQVFPSQPKEKPADEPEDDSIPF